MERKEKKNDRTCRTVLSHDGMLSMKLAPAKLAPDHVFRPRLSKSILSGPSNVIFVVASAGYGKTALLSEVYDRLKSSSEHVSWIHLDEYDNGYAFWEYLTEAVRRLFPVEDFSWVDDGAIVYDENDERSMFSWVNLFINQIASIDGSFTLILDNFHVIESYNIQLLMKHLLSYMPDNLRLIIASREPMPFSVSHMLMREEARIINEDDLAMTYSETAQFLNMDSGPELLTGYVWNIFQATHGWVTGIKLLRLSGANITSDGIVPSVNEAVSNEQLFDYFGDEILRSLDDDVREFLLDSSLFPELSASLCDIALERNDSREMLRTLEESSLFIHSVALGGNWYRIHPLFRNYLRQSALEDGLFSEKAMETHRRAAQWLEENDYETLALPHLLQSHSYERYLDLIESKYCQNGVRASFSLELVNPLSSIPRIYLFRHPKVLTLYMVILFHLGGSKELDSLILDVGSVDELLSRENEWSWDKKSDYAIRSLFAYANGEHNKVIEQFLEMIEFRDTFPDSIYGFMMILAARSFMAIGRIEDAITWLKESVRSAQEAGLVEERLAATNELARTLASIGRVNEAARVLDEGLRYSSLADSKSDGALFLSFSQVFLQREWGTLDSFDDVINNNQDFISRQIEDFSGWLQAPDFLLELSNCYVADNRADMAAICFRVTRDLIKSHLEVPYLAEQMAMARAKHWLSIGDASSMRIWADSAEKKRLRKRDNAAMLMVLALSTRHMIEDEPRRLLDQIDLNIKFDDELILAPFRVDYHMMRSWAQLRLGNIKYARVSLFRALMEADEYGLIRTVAAWGPWAISFMEQVAPGAPAEMSESLTRAVKLGQTIWHDGQEVPEWQRPRIVVDGGELSNRELEVLELLCELLTASQIAEKLGVSLSTVKSHTHAIYVKLGVHTKLEAIEKGKSLLRL